MTGTKKTALFILYILLTGTIMLYILFPSSAVKDHIANTINRNISDIHVDIGTLRLSFPPAVVLRDVTIEGDDNVLFFMERLKLTPRWHSMIFAKKALNFRANAYQGEISGSLSARTNREGAEVSASGTFSKMLLEQVPPVRAQLGDRLTGIVSGNFQLNAISHQPATGSGTIYVSDCSFIPSSSFMNLDRLSFQQIEAEFDFDGNYLEILNADLQGTELTGSAAGSIVFWSPISRSKMNLEVAVTPLLSSSLSGINALTFRASETFENPRFSIVSSR